MRHIKINWPLAAITSIAVSALLVQSVTMWKWCRKEGWQICGSCGSYDPTGRFDHEDDHGPACATVTGLWPVEQLDVEQGLCCEDCGHVFELDESYVSPQCDILCVGCAAIKAIS